MVCSLIVSVANAGPVDFGQAELAAAFQDRRVPVRDLPVTFEAGESESWSLQPDSIVAADQRGAMYGLLEAAEQVRANGRIKPTSGRPAVAMRGIRVFLHNEELEKDWYFSREYSDSYFAMLARNRFNRFNLVFAHQTNYLAPPYPYLVALSEFPQIRVPNLSDVQRERNLQTLCYISRAAADHGVDFTLGIWQQNAQVNQVPTVEGRRAKTLALTRVRRCRPCGAPVLRSARCRCAPMRSQASQLPSRFPSFATICFLQSRPRDVRST